MYLAHQVIYVKSSIRNHYTDLHARYRPLAHSGWLPLAFSFFKQVLPLLLTLFHAKIMFCLEETKPTEPKEMSMKTADESRPRGVKTLENGREVSASMKKVVGDPPEMEFSTSDVLAEFLGLVLNSGKTLNKDSLSYVFRSVSSRES